MTPVTFEFFSVEDAMPKDSYDVIAYRSRDKFTTIAMYEGESFWQQGTDDEVSEVTHWAYLHNPLRHSAL